MASAAAHVALQLWPSCGPLGVFCAPGCRSEPMAVLNYTLLFTFTTAGVHDNIVGLRGLCSHGGDLYLVMELCPR